MSALKWIPADGELDGLARSLPPPELSSERAEQNRTRVLASVGSVGQQSRRMRTPLIAIVGVPLAVAAAFVLYLVAREGAKMPGPKESIAELRPSRFERGTWPSYRLQLHDGRLAVNVASLTTTERFVVATTGAELEARGARFEVEVEGEHLAEVAVEEGIVELRVVHQPPVFLSAGEQWKASTTARVDEELVPTRTKAPDLARPPEVANGRIAIDTTRRDRTRKDGNDAAKRVRGETSTHEPPIPGVTSAAPKPGEAEFRRGWTALRASDPTGAATAFARACSEIKSDALGEDACYWAGVAAKRAGQPAAARSALARFIERFPSSGRAGEASALLGWLLYDAGDLDAAERRFKRAASDRVPTVKSSAERGLEAIARRRRSPSTGISL
ncbi:MAG: tetratricopeptide repeat protein [Kofleriaceae bacterium]